MEITFALGGVALGIGADAPSETQFRFHGPAALVTFLSAASSTGRGLIKNAL